MSSCDEALAEYNMAEIELADAHAMMVAAAAVVGVSLVALLAALALLAVLAPSLATPAAPGGTLIIGALGGIAVLSTISLGGGLAAVAFTAINWLRAMEKRKQAYAAVLNKCQGEPDRIPAPPVGA